MKKIIVRLLIALVVLILLAAVAVHLFLDSAVKRAVETIGPELTKVTVKLGTVNLSLLSGSGSVKQLVIGNPEGYKTPFAIRVGTARLALQPTSVLSDKVVLQTINLQEPEISFETDLFHNNLSKIQSNIEESTSGGKEPTANKEGKPPKRLEVDDFVISGGKIHVNVSTLGKSAMVALPEIHLKDLGRDPAGITPAELSKRVLQAIVTSATQAAAGAIADLQKGGFYLSTEPGTNAVNKVTRGLGDLLKKK
jgi:uncharacterized protein involved in outer membrane biogenesis